jgi:hypothetical protein
LSHRKLLSIFIMTGLIFGTLAAIQTKLTSSAFAQSQNIVCPTKDVQHWDKIVFLIVNPDLASKANLPANSELDIKVLDDPHKLDDIKQKILDFLNVPNEPRSSIQIMNVEYSIICNTSNSEASPYTGSTSTTAPPSNNPEPCPDGQPKDANGNCPDRCPDGTPMPKGGVAECPHPPRPDICPDGTPMTKGGVAECPHPPPPNNNPDTCPDGTPMPKGGVAECVPQPKSLPTPEAGSSPNPTNHCEDPVFANANTDKCTESGTMVPQDIEHNVGSGSNVGSGEVEHNVGSGSNGGGISTSSSQLTETVPSGLGEMIPSLGQFSGSSQLHR